MTDWTKLIEEAEQEKPQLPGAYISEAPSAEDVARREAELERTRATIAGAVNPILNLGLAPAETGLPMAASIAGGMIPYMFPKLAAPVARATAPLGKTAQAVAPSLAYSSVGSVGGTVAEQAILGKDIISPETGKKLVGNLIESAALDLGGNLTFIFGGKLFNVGKEQLSKFKAFRGTGSSEEEARKLAVKAVQEMLSKYPAATLTRADITGSAFLQQVEGVIREAPFAVNTMKAQQDNYLKAISDEAIALRDSLDVSPTFRQLLIQEKPTAMAVGERWKALHSEAERGLKDAVSPTYKALEEQGQGLFVDTRELKKFAQEALNRGAKTNFVGFDNEKKKQLAAIASLDNLIDISAAHDLRSALLMSARDAKQPGQASSQLEKFFNETAGLVQGSMNRAAILAVGNVEEKELLKRFGITEFVERPTGGLRTGQIILPDIQNIKKWSDLNWGTVQARVGNNELLRNYFNSQNAYRKGMEGLYSDVVSASIKASPSDVGKLLFNPDKPENLQDVYKAMVEMQKRTPKEAAGIKQELQYGFLSEAFKSQESTLNFLKAFNKDSQFNKTMRYLFPEPEVQNKLKVLADAVQFGKAEATPRNLLTKAIGTTGALGAAGTAYFLLPEETRSSTQWVNAGISGAVFLLTPRVIAKAMTNREALNALVGLASASNRPRYAGALAAKSIDSLMRTGVIDADYRKEVNSILYGESYAERMDRSYIEPDWSALIKEAEQQD